jgi:hypothetical protein
LRLNASNLRRIARVAAVVLCAARPAAAYDPWTLLAPCAGDCAVAVYGGNYVNNSMQEVLIDQPETPLTWDYQDDHILAVAVSREAGRWRRLSFEPELGVGQRFGLQDETELWAALFFRYHGFPWDDELLTTFAISTGMNWASGISEVERDRAKDDTGAQWMHFFSPEITFALPSRPDIELLFRFHHRSGVFGLVNDAFGGSQYGTVGLRLRF